MSTNDQPTEGDEPTVANYQPLTEGEFLTAGPAEQADAVDRLLAERGLLPTNEPAIASHNRRRAAAMLAGASTTDRFTAAVLAEFERFERERRAEIVAAGGDPDEDRDPLEYAKWLADRYVESRDDPQSLERYLRSVSTEITLEDARALRLAGEAATKATPRLVRLAKDEDKKDAPQIAAELGLTPSRVYDLLRRFVRYAWRVDAEEADGAWSPLGTGDVVGERRALNECDAAKLAVEQTAPTAAGRGVRVLVWENPKARTEQDGTEETALYKHIERP